MSALYNQNVAERRACGLPHYQKVGVHQNGASKVKDASTWSKDKLKSLLVGVTVEGREGKGCATMLGGEYGVRSPSQKTIVVF